MNLRLHHQTLLFLAQARQTPLEIVQHSAPTSTHAFIINSNVVDGSSRTSTTSSRGSGFYSSLPVLDAIRGGSSPSSSPFNHQSPAFHSTLNDDNKNPYYRDIDNVEKDTRNRVKFNFGNNGGDNDDGDDHGDDSYTEVYHEKNSAGDQLTNAITGLFIGPIIIIFSWCFLWSNESSAIKTHRSLQEALLSVHTTTSTTTSPTTTTGIGTGTGTGLREKEMKKNNGKLIHLSDMISVSPTDNFSLRGGGTGISSEHSSGAARDIDFGIARDVVLIRREVEIYQWVEERSESRRTLSDGSIQRRKKYKYRKKWVKKPVSTDNFRKKGYINHGQLPFQSRTFYADQVSIGGYTLAPEFIKQLTDNTAIPTNEIKKIPKGGRLMKSGVYFPFSGLKREGSPPTEIVSSSNEEIEVTVLAIDGEDKIFYNVDDRDTKLTTQQEIGERAPLPPSNLQSEAIVGDVRVTFSEVQCSEASIIGKIDGKVIIPWANKQGKGYEVALIRQGKHSAASMIERAQFGNRFNSWLCRGGGFLINYIGFSMITSVVSAAANVTLNWIPFFGRSMTAIVNLGVSFANFVLAFTTSSIVASIAWLFYRPDLGAPLLLISFGAFVFASQLGVAAGREKDKYHR